MNYEYDPITLFNAAGMSQSEWEEHRAAANGIGGSEVAAVMGESKFATNIDVYRRKIGEPDREPDEVTKFMFAAGHIMEPLVAQAFILRHTDESGQPEWELVPDTNMYRDSRYPFMTANVDYRLRHTKTGEEAILECKYVTPDSEGSWREGPPEYYVWQVRHYMAVLNPGHNPHCRAFIAALWGNNPLSHGTDWQVQRDPYIEEEMIAEEEAFWKCVEDKTPPVLKCHKLDALKRFLAESAVETTADETAILDPDTNLDVVRNYLMAQARSKNATAQANEAKGRLAEAEAQIIMALGRSENGELDAPDGTKYYISAHPKTETSVDLDKLQRDYPEVYEKVAKVKVTLGDLRTVSGVAFKDCTSTGPSTTRVIKVREVQPK